MVRAKPLRVPLHEEEVAFGGPGQEAGAARPGPPEQDRQCGRRHTLAISALCAFGAVAVWTSLRLPPALRASDVGGSLAESPTGHSFSFANVNFSMPSRGKGCHNWEQISLLKRTEITAEGCAQRCAGTAGCEGFGHQAFETEDCGSDGVARFTCSLFFGTCKEMDNACFDQYYVVDGPAGARAGRACPSKRRGDAYVVAVIFAGRREFMHILVHYVDKLVEDCLLDEVHVWDFARDGADSRWLEHIASTRPVYELQKPEGDSYWNPAYHYYSSSNRTGKSFVPRWKHATRNRTILIKMDDDVVYLNTDSFESFTNYVLSHTSEWLVHANIVNNGVAAYYQAHRISRLGKLLPDLLYYPNDYDDPERAKGAPVTPGRYGKLLRNSTMSAELHRDFLANMAEYAWEDPSADSCIVYGTSNKRNGQGRFSINVFGTTWHAWDSINALVTDDFATNPMPEDEQVLTVNATMQGLEECMFTPFTVSHWSFGCQQQPMELLHSYEELLIDRRRTSEAIGHSEFVVFPAG